MASGTTHPSPRETHSTQTHGAGRGMQTARLACALLLVFAAIVAAWPFAADMYGTMMSEREFTRTMAASRDLAQAQVESQVHQAREYNREVAGSQPGLNAASYGEQMSLSNDDVLCWLEIPKLSLKVPVYKGSEDADVVAARLMEGAVHMIETSLPVGGRSTHTAITAHSGMAHARMFDNIGKLAAGDTFTLWTYGEPLIYEVYAQETVEPGQVGEHVRIAEGKDLATLITCTPYGENTHRILVHAKRVLDPVKASSPASLPATADALSSPRVLLLIAAIALSGAAAAICARTLRRERKPR